MGVVAGSARRVTRLQFQHPAPARSAAIHPLGLGAALNCNAKLLKMVAHLPKLLLMLSEFSRQNPKRPVPIVCLNLEGLPAERELRPDRVRPPKETPPASESDPGKLGDVFAKAPV
jgi:hypothetical protein